MLVLACITVLLNMKSSGGFSVPAGTEWTLCSWGSCSFGCQSVAWWTHSPSWRECGDGLWFGWRCPAHSLREWKREWAATRDIRREGGGGTCMIQRQHPSIHPSRGLIPFAAVLFNVGERKVHLEREIEWGCLTDSPSFYILTFFFSLPFFFFCSWSAPFLKKKKQLHRRSKAAASTSPGKWHTGLSNCEIELVTMWFRSC